MDEIVEIEITGDERKIRTFERELGGDLVDGDVRISKEDVNAFLSTLVDAPLVDRPYVPVRTSHANSYVAIRLETYLGSPIEFASSSAAHDHVPWVVTTRSRSYVIPDGTPSRAIEQIGGLRGIFSHPRPSHTFLTEVLSRAAI